MYKQGDIIVVKFPYTDGSEFKKRPALIVSNSKANYTEDFLLMQITSKFNDDGLSILIENIDCLQPMPLKSYVRTHKLFTANKSIILSKITEVKPSFLKNIALKINELIEVLEINKFN